MANSIRSTARILRGAPSITHASGFFFHPFELVCCGIFCGIGKEKRARQLKTMKERRNTQPLVVRCKLVLVGDVQCGKTAMLQVLAKDCYPEVIPEKNTSKYLHNFACVCCGLDFVKTFKDGRRVRAHFADKSCAIPQYFTLQISTRKCLIHAFAVTPERPLLT